MANTLDIRRRIRSVKNTSQITKAMQMVAASKMRKAQAAALAGRPFQDLLWRVLASLRGRVNPNDHELLRVRPVQRELVVVFSTDKGLCGALNTNLFREVAGLDSQKTLYVTCGRRAVQYVARTKRDLVADFPLGETPSIREIRPIGSFCRERFESGEVDQVRVLYPYFVNTLTQAPTLRSLLPIPIEELGLHLPEGGTEYIFEPDEPSVLSAILPRYINFQLFQMVLDSRASEQSARMVAMKSATDNAKELVKHLTLEYNKIRQASITTELLEITTAQLALE
jgi:F-type H+-transporting ATPase subunit gamma